MSTFRGQTYFNLDAGERARDVALAAVGGAEWVERASAVVRAELAGQEVLAESFRVVDEQRIRRFWHDAEERMAERLRSYLR